MVESYQHFTTSLAGCHELAYEFQSTEGTSPETLSKGAEDSGLRSLSLGTASQMTASTLTEVTRSCTSLALGLSAVEPRGSGQNIIETAPSDSEHDRESIQMGENGPLCIISEQEQSIFLLPGQSYWKWRHSHRGSEICISLINILNQVLCKIREERKTVLLVVPKWPTQSWFPELLEIGPVASSIEVLYLLSQVNISVWHLNPGLWNLRFNIGI